MKAFLERISRSLCVDRDKLYFHSPAT